MDAAHAESTDLRAELAAVRLSMDASQQVGRLGPIKVVSGVRARRGACPARESPRPGAAEYRHVGARAPGRAVGDADADAEMEARASSEPSSRQRGSAHTTFEAITI